MLKVALRIAAAISGAAIAAALAGTWRWNRETAAALARLGGPTSADPYRESLLVALPVPVQRYFHTTLKDGQRMIRAAQVTQEAEFFINNAWRPLKATQSFRTSPPAFVWDARIDMAPLLPAYVRDSYIDGHGAMKAGLYGVITLANLSNLHELSLGALQRFLGEAIWLPTALLPSPLVTWTPGDDHSATATLRDAGHEVSLRFEFDDTGSVRTISGDRYKEAQGNFALEKWRITCGEVRERNGMRIPMRCEVAWIDQDIPQPYWRGHVTSIDYQYN